MTMEEFMHRFVTQEQMIRCDNAEDRIYMAQLITENTGLEISEFTGIMDPDAGPRSKNIVIGDTTGCICGCTDDYHWGRPYILYEDAISALTDSSYVPPTDAEFEAALNDLLS